MLNNVALVGRISKIEKLEDKKINLTIATQRTFKNASGEYETDLIKIVVLKNISSTIDEYCECGDIVGVKGRIQGNGEEIQIIAERVTFLQQKKND